MNRAVDAAQEAWDSSEEGRQKAMAAVRNLVDDLGVTATCHTFNAMGAFHHRSPGAIGAALTRRGPRLIEMRL